MPSDHSGGLYNHERITPTFPQTGEEYPERPIQSAELGLFPRSRQNRYLVPERKILQNQGIVGFE